MNFDDRKMIANIIRESTDDCFIIVHGTDTMHMSAEFLDEVFNDRKIVLTGAMKPLEIDKIEASFNLGMALGFLKSNVSNGVYICMNGLVVPWNEIEKNRTIGKFEIV
jgi:L-asparaginase